MLKFILLTIPDVAFTDMEKAESGRQEQLIF